MRLDKLLLNPSLLSPSLISLLSGGRHLPVAAEPPLRKQLMYRLEHNGEPLLMLPLEHFGNLLTEP